MEFINPNNAHFLNEKNLFFVIPSLPKKVYRWQSLFEPE
jgi:hypothetical protein